MARETQDERILRLSRERNAAQAAAEAALEAYLLTVPKRLMDAQALAQRLGVNTRVDLTVEGPSVHFHDDASVIDAVMTYQTEEWELEYLERKLRDLKIDQEARIYRRGVAEDAWKNKLSEAERVALKENIQYLR